MAGGVIIIVVLAVVFPVLVLMTMGALAAGLGAALNKEVDGAHEGSELLTLSRTNSSVPVED